MTQQITLNHDKIALVDDSDYPSVSKYHWCAHTNGYVWYAIGRVNGTAQFLHRLLMNAPKGILVDHIDGNGLNCQRSNMRLCDKYQNQANKGLTVRNTSGFKGVSWDRTRNKWRSSIKIVGRSITIGRFETATQAAKAYDEFARQFHGEFAKTNF